MRPAFAVTFRCNLRNTLFEMSVSFSIPSARVLSLFSYCVELKFLRILKYSCLEHVLQETFMWNYGLVFSLYFVQKERCCSGIRVTTEERLHMYRHYLSESQLAELPRFHAVRWQAGSEQRYMPNKLRASWNSKLVCVCVCVCVCVV